MLKTFVAAASVVLLGAAPIAQDSKKPSKESLPTVTVYRTPTCGCCGKWVEHLKSAGFTVSDHVIQNLETAQGRAKVPLNLRSCHTALVGRYVVEGHIPADVVKDLLRKRPNVEGIAVPGMPAGSPGMESPYPVAYDVIAFDKNGATSRFAHVTPKR